MMKPGHDKRCIQQTKHRGEQESEIGGKSCVNYISDGIADRPADGAYNGMCDDDSRNQ